MQSQFSEAAPGGTVSGTRTVRRQSRGLIVEYALEWTGGDPVAVRLADRIPTADVEEYGFHEDHEPPEWSFTGGELDLEAGLEPGTERRLVLGLLAEDVDASAIAEDEPAVDVLGGNGDRDPDASRPVDADGSDDDLTVDLDEPGAGPESGLGPKPPEADGPVDGDSADGRRVDADGGVVNHGPDPDESVASRLIAEIEAGTVPQSELSTLRDHLSAGAESEAVRLEYVQKRLSDFDAYVDALEDLLSVHGSGDDAITDLDERLDGLADEVESVRRRQDELADRLEALCGSLDEQAEALESHRATHEADVDELRTDIRRRDEVLREEFDDLQRSLDEDLAALETEIEAFESIRRTLVDGLQRPEDLRAGTTVEDADPGALDETEAIPIVDPAETDDGDEPDDGDELDDRDAVELEAAEADPALESGAASDDADERAPPMTDEGDAPTDDEPDVSVDLEENLETAEASNFSGPTEPTDDETGRLEAGAETEADRDEAGRFVDEFVHPASDGRGEVADEEGGDGSADGSDVAAEADAGAEGSGEFVVPGPDVDGADESEEVGDPGVEAALQDEAGVEPDRGADDDDDDDSDGRASSIFEIGDVDSEGSSDDETPTIDFEDS